MLTTPEKNLTVFLSQLVYFYLPFFLPASLLLLQRQARQTRIQVSLTHCTNLSIYQTSTTKDSGPIDTINPPPNTINHPLPRPLPKTLQTHTLTQPPPPRSPDLPILILLPIRQDVPDPWRVRQPINLLEILFLERERLRGDIRDVLPDQLPGIDRRLVDFLQQKRAEGLDA